MTDSNLASHKDRQIHLTAVSHVPAADPARNKVETFPRTRTGTALHCTASHRTAPYCTSQAATASQADDPPCQLEIDRARLVGEPPNGRVQVDLWRFNWLDQVTSRGPNPMRFDGGAPDLAVATDPGSDAFRLPGKGPSPSPDGR